MKNAATTDSNANPLLADWSAAFGLPPFAAIRPEHFRPAFDQALAAHRAELDAVTAVTAVATFTNTIEALERSGRALDRVSNVFFVLTGADTGDALEAV
jgi:peptidyl-dipeptidase Dcp